MFYICNKCCATAERGEKPYSLTACGHVYCCLCVDDARNKCPQCQIVNATAIAIKEPLPAKIRPFFQPLQEHANLLWKAINFQEMQQKISYRRFIDLDKKYELVKRRYMQAMDANKGLLKKINELKEARRQDQKRMTLIETQYRNLISPATSSSVFKTPSTRNTPCYVIKYDANVSSARSAGQESTNFITPMRNPRKTTPKIPLTGISHIARLNINTPMQQEAMNPTYSYQKYTRS